MEKTISHAAQVEAYLQFLRGLLTEPMTSAECADHFRVCKKTMRKILNSMEGIKKLPGGRFLRIPLREMPPEYLVSRGVLRFVEPAK